MADQSQRHWSKIRNIVKGLQWFERKEAASRCGVYILMCEGTAQYIGKSIRVDARLVTHRTNGKFPFDAVLFAAVEPEFLDDVERELLLQYEPPKNMVYPAKDHGRILNRALRKLFRKNNPTTV